jgi:hypothetical protein
MFGAKRIMAVSLGGIAVLNLLVPVASRALAPDEFPWILVLIRALMGVFGVRNQVLVLTYKCIHR